MFKVRYQLALLFAATLVVAGSASVLADTPTDQQVNDTRKFIEFAFGFQLDGPSVQAIRDGMTIDFANDPSGSAQNMADIETVLSWVRSKPASVGALVRSLLEPELIAAWQDDTSASAATSKTLVAVWRKHNKIIAEGHPPLRRDVVNAYIQMFEFVSKQAGKRVPAQIANHSRFTAQVADQYAASPPEGQMKFNKVQTLWLALQTIWAQASPEDRAAMRDHWRGKAPQVAPQVATETAAPQSGVSGSIFDAKKYDTKLFVDRQTQLFMSNWTNPTAMY